MMVDGRTRGLEVDSWGSMDLRGIENPARSSKEMGENPIRRKRKGSLFKLI